jgi:hypothetical protein
MKPSLSILVFLIILSNCTNRSMVPADYVKWVKSEKNGLYQEKQTDEYVFCLQYKPLDYVALLEQRPNETFDNKQFEADKNKMKGLEHYTFSIRTKEKGNPLKQGISLEKEAFERENYFSYQLQNDLLLVEGKDTLACAFSHFERTYELSPYITFIVGFERKPNSKQNNRQFIYRDRILGTGTIKMIIKKAAIKRMPKLNLN